MVGDGSSKSRSNTNLEDCRGEGVQGVVAMTGELTGKGLSSNLRCFYCGISREDVDEEMVTYFQDNPYFFTTLINHFASYVASDWERIVNFIKKNFQEERTTVRRFLKERRLVDSAVVLRLTCEFIRGFLLQCGSSAEKTDRVIKEMQNEILMMAQISEDIALEETFAVRFAKITDQLLLSKKLNIIDHSPNKEDITFIDGFCDKDCYYFLPEKLYEKVKQVFCITGVYLPLSMDELVKELFEENIIVPSSNGTGKKTYYARVLVGADKKRGFLKIKKQTLQMLSDEE